MEGLLILYSRLKRAAAMPPNRPLESTPPAVPQESSSQDAEQQPSSNSSAGKPQEGSSPSSAPEEGSSLIGTYLPQEDLGAIRHPDPPGDQYTLKPPPSCCPAQ